MAYSFPNPVARSLRLAGLAVLSLATCLFPVSGILAASPLSLSTPSATGSGYSITVSASSGGTGINGADITLILPAGVSYVSADSSQSILETEVSPPTVTGASLRFARVSLLPNGYRGDGGVLTTIVLKGSLAAVSGVRIDTASSQLLDSSSKNLLTSGIPATVPHSEAPRAIAIAAILTAGLALAILSLFQRRRTSGTSS